MKKPTSKTLTYFDYMEMQEYIEDTYKIKGHLFFQWWVRKFGRGNDNYWRLPLNPSYDSPENEEALKFQEYLFKEFGDGENIIDVWVCW